MVEDIVQQLWESIKNEDLVNEVWEKGNINYERSPNSWRTDDFRNWIKRSEYGNRKSVYGWEIDHTKPKSKGGTDDLSNLRPLQWEANVKRN